MSALSEAVDWQDSKELSKPKKKPSKGALRQELRDSRKSGDMTDLQHFLEPLHRHRQTLWTMVLTAILVNVIWIVLVK